MNNESFEMSEINQILQEDAGSPGTEHGASTPPNSLYGVKGWLKFFVVVNMYIAPVLFGIQLILGFVGLVALSEEYPSAVIVGLIEAAVGIFFTVKWILIARRLRDIVPGVVPEAKRWLLILLVWRLFDCPLALMLGGESPDVIKGLLQAVIGFAIWFSYFNVSKRVKATYSTRTNRKASCGIILRAEDVHKAYHIGKRAVEVLHGVSLEVRRGETLSIMGASGSGKSTLLHVLGGLDRPDVGDVFFGEESISAMAPERRAAFRVHSVGFVFQSYHLLPELDILENVMLPAMAVKGGPDARARARNLLEQVGLSDRMDHRPQELSGGEQQRVAIARALMNEPDLILADEPTGNLDSHTGENVLQCLFDLAHSEQRTLIMVTHNEEVARLCQRELILKDGKLEE